MPLNARFSIDALIVSREATIREAMQVIDRTGMEIALICDPSRRLLGVLTDGDIRRALLGGQTLADGIANICRNRFISVGPGVDRQEAMRLMVDRAIKCLPVIDDAGHLLDLHTLHGVLAAQQCTSWAVVMAGGLGTRLGELTQAIPKPMLPIGDRPILQHIVEHLVSHGVRRIFLAVNYLGRMIEDHFRDGHRFHCRIEYLREDEPRGTGGALGLLPERPSSPLIVMNGDLLTRISLTRMLEFHRSGAHQTTMAVREHRVQVPFGVAQVAGSRVTALVEKPVLDYQINAGIYVVEPHLLDRIPPSGLFPITRLIEDCLVKGERVGAYSMSESWSDIGLPDEYRDGRLASHE